MKTVLSALLITTWVTSTAAARAAGGDSDALWHHWRGPDGTGVAHGDAPTHWTDTENVVWKVAIPGRGTSTPIVWGERLFLTTAVPTGREAAEDGEAGEREFHGGGGAHEEQAFVVLCLDRSDGSTVWEATLRTAVPHEGFHKTYGSFASFSPVAEENRLYVSFGSQGVFCLDHEGEVVWEQDLGVQMEMRRQFGEGASPTLYGDALVHVFDHEGDSFIVCLDKETGEVRWRAERDEPSSWAGPLVLEHDGVEQVVVSGTNRIRSYELSSGRVIWECGGLGLNAIPMPVVHGGQVILMSGYRNANTVAVRLGGEGDLTGSDAVVWSSEKGSSYTPSPVLHGGKLYCVQDRGFISCFDAATGEAHYLETRLPRGADFKASPVGAAGKLYLPAEDGTVHVVRMGTEYELIASNALEDQFFIASPAIVDGQLYLRSLTHLFCIGAE